MVKTQGSQANDSFVGGSPTFGLSLTNAGDASCEHPNVEHAPFSVQQWKWWISLQRGQVTTLSPALNATSQAEHRTSASFSALKVHTRSWMVSGMQTPSLKSNLSSSSSNASISLGIKQNKPIRSAVYQRALDVLRRTSILFMLILLLLPTAAQASAYTTASIIENMNKAMRQPVVMQYKQEAYARGLLGFYRWTSTITQNGSDIQVDSQNAPSFVSADMMKDISDFRKAMERFNWEYTGITRRSGKEYLTLKGVRKPHLSSGATEADVLIDPATYLIIRIEARYSWGKMSLDQSYIYNAGVAYLEKQEGSLSPWMMKITVTYSDYKY
jgi:hypothetical protein